jgi:hypothetical protein
MYDFVVPFSTRPAKPNVVPFGEPGHRLHLVLLWICNLVSMKADMNLPSPQTDTYCDLVICYWVKNHLVM